MTIVEPKDELAMDGGKRHRFFTLRRIDENPNSTVYTNTAVERISGRSVAIVKGTERLTLENVDLVVMALGSASDRALADEMMRDDLVPEFHYVGDCFLPRKTLQAMLEAAEASYRV